MKKVRIFLGLFVLLLIAHATFSQDCPKSGSAKRDKEKKLNIAKNKSVTVSSSKIPVFIPLDSLVTTVKQEDEDWFENGTYVYTEGYLINAIEEGGESCNCEEGNASQKTGDVHMYLGLTKAAKTKNCLVVEITPAFKKKYPDYEKYLTLKKKIRVTGYLLYDFIHRKDALMTCKKCTKIWRNNCWEIHPITKLKVL
jgi:hypothetical protein